jgi:predicted RNA-binding protein with RPS1 domain
MDKRITWDELKIQVKQGDIIEGSIIRHEPYGVFVDIDCPFEGLIEIPEFRENGIMMTQQEYPHIGERVKAVVLGFKDMGSQVKLSVRPSRLNKI